MTVTSTSNDWDAADRANEPIRGSSADVAKETESDLVSRATHTHSVVMQESCWRRRDTLISPCFRRQKNDRGRFMEPSVTDKVTVDDAATSSCYITQTQKLGLLWQS